MEDPALEDETTDADVWAEIQRMRDDFHAKYGTDIRAACEAGRRLARSMGMIEVDVDHPLHPFNLERQRPG
jgi:hypothetical protein